MANTAAFHDRPTAFTRVNALWSVIVDVIRETQALRAKYGHQPEN